MNNRLCALIFVGSSTVANTPASGPAHRCASSAITRSNAGVLLTCATAIRGDDWFFTLSAVSDSVLERVQRLVPIAEGLGLSMPQLALAWVLREANVASAIVGASRPEQVHQNASASGIDLDAATLTEIDAILR